MLRRHVLWRMAGAALTRLRERGEEPVLAASAERCERIRINNGCRRHTRRYGRRRCDRYRTRRPRFRGLLEVSPH